MNTIWEHFKDNWHIYIICACVAYFVWWLLSDLSEIKEKLDKLLGQKHDHLNKKLGEINSTLKTGKNEISTSIRVNERNVKAHISSEIATLRQMIMTQFTNQTNRLSEDIARNRSTITSLISTLENILSSLDRKINDNKNKISALISTTSSESTSIKSAIQLLGGKYDKMEKANTAAFNSIIKQLFELHTFVERHLKLLEESGDINSNVLNESLQKLTNSIKQHTDKISSTCSQMMSSEKELHQKTKGSFDAANSNLVRYLSQLKQIENLYSNLQQLFNKMIEQEKKIIDQEGSLTAMVSRHAQIFELTSELNSTSKEIFEFMKLFLIQSTLDNYKRK